MIDSVFRTLSLVLVTAGLTYLFTSIGMGLRMQRRLRRASSDTPASADVAVFVMIPCLNEATVIDATVQSMLAQGEDATIVVIDDGSDDDTAAIVEALDEPRVIVHRRTLPTARLGKGAALNDGLALVRRLVAERELDPNEVVVCVMDADGRLSEGTLAGIGVPFADPQVGGVQLPVRIRNRHGRNLLPKMQDLEFWALSATTQTGRMSTQTVSLGGNGQFSRLSALEGLGDEPWSDSLTEDLDLAVSLAEAGWRLTCLPSSYVDQQGVTDVRALFKQRTRWFQGHMATGRRIPEIWRSNRLDNVAALELSTYLLVPWVFVLPWSIVGHYALYQSIRALGAQLAGLSSSSSNAAAFGLLGFWYVTGFLPNIVLGVIYFRRDRAVGRVHALALAHLMIPYNYLGYAAAWRAAWRLARGTTGWAKTDRVVEGNPSAVAPAVASALAPARATVATSVISTASVSDLAPVIPISLAASATRERPPMFGMGDTGAVAVASLHVVTPDDDDDADVLGRALISLMWPDAGAVPA